MLKLKLLQNLSLILALGFIAESAMGQSSRRSILNKKYITTVDKVTKNEKHKSTEGRPLILFRVAKSPKPKHRFLIQGGMHGNEKLTSTFVVWLANRFARGESLLNKIKTPIAIDFLPSMNPDGIKRNYRYNKRAVNLNRNFGVLWGMSRENPGTHPFSESESQALKSLLDTQKYTAAIDVHGYINWIVLPSTPKMVKRERSPEAVIYEKWLQATREEMDLLPRYLIKRAGSLGDGGAFEDYAFWGAGTLSLCLEMSNATRFAEINTRIFPKGTDTFLKYEEFLARMFQRAMTIKQSPQFQVSFSEKNVGKAKTPGSIPAFKYLSPSSNASSLE